MASLKIVGYLRVSTDEQGKSGLGLEAQKMAIESYANSAGALIIGWHTDIMSGKIDARPALHQALKQCRLYNATLVVAKVDRLSRKMSTICTLLEGDVSIIAADSPNDSTFILHIKASVAQEEREKISQRTKAALAAKKAQGFKLGNPNSTAVLRAANHGNGAGIIANKAKADTYALRVIEVIDQIKAEGVTTLTGIAAVLTAREVPTARGGTAWQAVTVKRIIDRVAA
jgi:DNA invertase Pin-like site-specific DNA recombinase